MASGSAIHSFVHGNHAREGLLACPDSSPAYTSGRVCVLVVREPASPTSYPKGLPCPSPPRTCASLLATST